MAEVTLIELVSRYLLRYRKITCAKAYELYGTMRLGSIISDLRKRGYPIETVYVEKPNRYGKMIRYGIYYLKDGWSLKDLEKQFGGDASMEDWIFAAWFGIFGFIAGMIVELLVNSKELDELKQENVHLRQELADRRSPDLEDILYSEDDFT